MKKKFTHQTLLFLSCLLLLAGSSKGQFTFSNSNSLLPIAAHSGCAITVVDVNNDGLDDILIMDQSQKLILQLHNMDGSFTRDSLTTVPGGHVWGMAAADVDHNGWKDVVTGAGTAYLVKLYPTGGTVIATTVALPLNYFVQNITFGDFNNDGWVDLAVCDDNDYMKIYQNNSGTMAITTSLINTNINPGMYVGSDPYDSGNYGSVWTDIDNDGDLDLYIAHCRQSAASNTDQRRRDRLFINNGSNVYTEDAQAHGIEVTDFKQTWTTSFGDMDNDGDMDVVMTNHGEASQILQNNGSGMFTDVTAGTGFAVGFDAIESVVEDFDNDGFLDILVSGPNWVMYHNNGNGTYTSVPTAFSAGPNNLLSFAIGDLNHDGKIDVYASYGTVYNNPTATNDVLYMNTTSNTNHFITFNLEGTTSNKGAIGAKVTIYGPWGKQVREVRSGESYGTSNSMQLHFGLGANTIVDSARIDWPSHSAPNHFTNLQADQFVSVIEGTCSITGNILPPGPYFLCAGQTTTLTAAAGFSSYLWSNTNNTQTATISASGMYNVKVGNAAGCYSISPSVLVQLNPDETPSVSNSGLLSPCAGTVTLTSSTAASYVWTGPSGFTATTQSINPTLSGNYYVTIQGTCGSFNSALDSINLLAAPAPVTTGASGIGPVSLNLSATSVGSGTLSWYDAPTGGALLTTGTNYTTPILTTTTTYYVEEATTYLGAIGHAGLTYNHDPNPYNGSVTNGVEFFDVITNCTLQSVKVYTDSAGTRDIILMNNLGTVIDTFMVYLPADTTVVPLNWSLTPGTGYQLTTKSSVNIGHWGGVSPILKRTGTGVTYPITLNNMVSLTGTNPTGGRYYYFYDWVVQRASDICLSPRVPVVANVSSLGINSYSLSNVVSIYPNPATEEVNLKFESTLSTAVQVELTDVIGRKVNDWNLEKPYQGEEVKLNISHVSAGTYFITVKTDTSRVVEKLVITR